MSRKPRISVSLKPETYEMITTIAQVSGKTHSSTLSDLLDELAPVLKAVYDSFLVIKQEQERLELYRQNEYQDQLLSRLNKLKTTASSQAKKIQKDLQNVTKIRG